MWKYLSVQPYTEIFFELNLDKCNFKLGLDKVQFTQIEKILVRCPKCAKPQNNGKTFVLHPPSTHGVHREFGINLRSNEVVNKIKSNCWIVALYVIHYLGKIQDMEYQYFVKESFTNLTTK
jgi:hypothetical protein